MTHEYLQKAQKEITEKLSSCGIKIVFSEFVEKSYVFEIEEIPRGKRPYFRVRYSFKGETKDSPKPDW